MSDIAQDQNKLILDAMGNDLLSYAMGIYPKFKTNKFAEALCWEIQNALDGNCDRLIIEAPPRHGKTLITSEIAPAFFMGRNPNKKIIAASHTHGLAADNGSKVRDKLSDPLHESIFGKEGSLNRSKAAMDNFQTNGKGEYFAVGVGGTPIGKGADVYIIDDPIRSRADVESENQREALKSWYSSSVLTRLEGQGTIILMHQRWHEDDLAGYLLREHAQDGWRVVSFPAIIENEEDQASDYLKRNIGESLVPELHSTEKLLRLKDTMHPRDWLSMYQQKPRNPKGEEFTENHLIRVDQDPFEIGQTTNRYLLVDPANSKKKHSDFTAMVVIGLGSDRNYYILDAIRERLDLAGRTEKLMAMHRLWRPIITGYEQYGAQSDIQHIQHIQNEVNYRFPITQLGGNTHKKEERIRRLVPDMSQGRWYAPSEIIKVNGDGDKYDPITQLIEEEMIPFPMGKNDDLLDDISRIYDLPTQFPSASNMYRRTGKKVSPW